MGTSKPTYIPLFELNGLHDKPASTTRKMHIRRLNDILHLSIERGDFSRARRAWAILARCKEFDWKTKWRTGLLLLSDDPLSGQHQHLQVSGGSVEFLKKFMRHYPDEQESVLQETILHLANEGKFREALDELDLYLPSFPFQENSILLAYAGLFSFRLAISFSDDKIQSLGNINLLQNAQNYFARALTIDPDNDVPQAFSKEVTGWLAQASANKLQDPKESTSDDEMEVDGSNPSMRDKRIRRTTNGESQSEN